jgi:hypothetical protein
MVIVEGIDAELDAAREAEAALLARHARATGAALAAAG